MLCLISNTFEEQRCETVVLKGGPGLAAWTSSENCLEMHIIGPAHTCVAIWGWGRESVVFTSPVGDSGAQCSLDFENH